MVEQTAQSRRMKPSSTSAVLQASKTEKTAVQAIARPESQSAVAPAVHERPKVVLVTNQKGGVGKTTVVLALAFTAMNAGQKAALLDCDPQASLWKWAAARKRTVKNLDFDHEPMVLATPAQRETVEAAVETAAAQGCEWVFIDTAPSVAGNIVDLMSFADVVLIPVRDGAFDIAAVMSTIDLCKGVGKSPIMILNDVPPNARKSMGELAEAMKKGKNVSIGPALGRRAEVKHAQIAFRTTAEAFPKSRANEEVIALWNYVRAMFHGEDLRHDA